jgi:S1-C subfamily serine protease
MSEKAFCEKNVKSWLTTLVALSLLLLGYTSYLAFGKTDTSGFAAKQPPLALPYPQGAARTVALTPMDSSAIPLGSGLQTRVEQPARGPVDLGAFKRAAELVRPSVVNINAIRPIAPTNATQRGAAFVDPLDAVPLKMIGQRPFESVGSGVIVDSTGYVVTNHHVVTGATEVVAELFGGGGNCRALFVAEDRANDLVLLRLTRGGPFTPVVFADSDKVRVGDWVLAVGNPFGLEHTVTHGIISGMRNALVIAGLNYRDLFQTDAPINAGSSGGALVDLEGRMIGLNTAIFAPTGVFNGTGFAIPSNRVRAFIERYLRPAGAAPSARAGDVFYCPRDGSQWPASALGPDLRCPRCQGRLGRM